ncbi:MAG: DUF421 domain-containing protein [Nocardioides sp.]
MEIALRAVVVFVFLWVVTRAVGRTTLGELSTFELLLFVTMGDLVQQSITQQDFSVTGGLIAVSVFALMTVMLSWVQWRFPRTRGIVNGTPVVVAREGRLLDKAARQQRLSDTDLMAAARQQGIRSMQDVDLAILEADGKLSFFTRDSSSDGAPAPPEVG